MRTPMTKDELWDYAATVINSSVEKEGYEISERINDLLIAIGRKNEFVFIFLAVAMAPKKPTKEDVPELAFRTNGHKERGEKCFFAAVSLMGPSINGMPIRGAGFYTWYPGLEEI